MKMQRLLLAAFGFVTLVAANGCVVHEHGHDDWDHHHSHTVIVEPVHHD